MISRRRSATLRVAGVRNKLDIELNLLNRDALRMIVRHFFMIGVLWKGKFGVGGCMSVECAKIESKV